MTDFFSKKEKLNRLIMEIENPVVAYSGGVDSSLLTALAFRYHKDTALAVFASTPFIDEDELEYAKKQADKKNWKMQVVTVDPFVLPEVRTNTKERCYYCKTMILSELKKGVDAPGASTFLEGSNFDDEKHFRPGARAVKEQGFLSPLLEVEFTKEDVRRYASALLLPAADKPSRPCLLTRFPYHMESGIKSEVLNKIKEGEHLLSKALTDNFRLRYVDDHTARIEASLRNQGYLREHPELLKKIPFDTIIIDKEPFQSGSFDRKKDKYL